MAPKITIYGSKMATCTQRVLILLEELQLPYKLQEIDLASGEQHSKQFLKLNPFGKVPVLRYTEESGKESSDNGSYKEYVDERMLYEARCILRFLANKHDKETDYYPNSNCDMWLEIESQNLNSPLSKIVYEKVFKQMRGESDVNEELVKSSLLELDKVLRIYEDNLSKSNFKFISGDTFTIADIACIPYLNYFVKCQGKDFLKQYPRFYHWFKKVKSRESVKKIIGNF